MTQGQCALHLKLDINDHNGQPEKFIQKMKATRQVPYTSKTAYNTYITNIC